MTRLVARAKHVWDIERLGDGDYYKYLHAKGQAKWLSVVRAFDEIKSMTFQRDIKVVVMIFPFISGQFLGKSWADHPYRAIRRQVSNLAMRNGFPVVDLLDEYSNYAPCAARPGVFRVGRPSQSPGTPLGRPSDSAKASGRIPFAFPQKEGSPGVKAVLAAAWIGGNVLNGAAAVSGTR